MYVLEEPVIYGRRNNVSHGMRITLLCNGILYICNGIVYDLKYGIFHNHYVQYPAFLIGKDVQSLREELYIINNYAPDRQCGVAC